MTDIAADIPLGKMMTTVTTPVLIFRAVDSIIDIVSTAIAIDYQNRTELYHPG